MATQITTLTAGYILIQAGRGIPNHLAPKGSQFTDVDTATLYFNKNGLSDWEINIDVGNTGSTVGINTFSSFSSSTIGQGSVIATTSNDNLTFSGVNLSILVDNTNQILTLSAATPSNYTFTGGTVNGLTNFTNGLSATTISATTFYGNGANLTGISAQDTYLTGGTYNNGTAIFTNNTGGTFTVSGFKTSDIFVTGGTYNNSTGVTTFTNNTGGTFTVSGYFKSTDDIYTTGMTFNSSNYNLSITRNDGTSYSQSLAILASDMTITGGTYNNSTGVATFTNNTGGTFSVGGFLTGMTDTYTTGFTYSNNTLTLKRNASQPDLSVMINSMTGLTVNGTISTTTISATTYQNLPTDIRVTGGTYSNGTTTFTNNTGGTFTVSGFKIDDLVVTGGTYNSGSILFTNNTGGTFTVSGLYTGYTAPVDVTVTGGTYNTNSGIATFTNNTGGTFTLTGFKTSDLVVTGGTYSNGSATFTNNTGGTFSVSGFKTDDVFVTGGTYSNGAILFTNNTGGTFNVNGLYTGYTAPVDVTVTGGTYSSGTATFTNNTGGTFTVSGFKTDDLVVTGGTYNNGSILFTNNTGGTFNVTGLYTGYTAPIDVTVTGGTYSSGTATFTNNTGGTFSVAGFKTDDIYTTGMTFNTGSYDLSITRNDGTSFTQSLAALASDMTITGGTYNNSTGVATFTNNTGGTFNVSGFLTGMTDTYATGLTFSNNVLTLKQTNNQADLDILINNLSGLTVNGSLSATTFYGNGSNLTGLVTQDTVVTGGTYNSGSILFTNNTGGTFNVTGLYTGYTAPVDVFTTGATYSNNTFTYTNNTGGTFDVLFNTMTGLTVTGDLIVSGNTQSIFSGDSSSDLVRITQTGSGNALVIEDSTNPDSTPFVVNTSGFVGIGVTSPTNPLHISGSTDQIKLSNGSSAWTVASKSNGDFVAVATGSRASMYFGSYGVTNSVRISSTSALIVNSSSDSYFTGAGNLIIYNGLSANTISATTYFNLPTDITVTGGTYTSGAATFTNNTGGTFTVTGFSTSNTTAFTGGTVSGATNFTGGLSATTISATTYFNLPTDIRVTGGTFNDTTGVATFTNNTGGTFTVTGFSTGGGSTFTGGTVTGPTNFTNGLTATTISATTYFNLPTDVRVTGGTYTNGTATFTNNTGGTFTVTGFSTGGTAFTGGTVTGSTNFTNGLTANTMSATTYYGDGSNLTGISAVATEFVVNCRNQSGSDMYRGQVVYINSSTGNKPTIQLSIATGETTSARTFGVLKNDIANNAFGDVVTIGSITNLDTRTSATHPFTNDTLNDGDTVYLSPITQGFITNVKPSAPNHLVYIGKVIRTSPTDGYIEYQIMNGFELDELHNVKVNDITVGDLLTYSGYNGTNVWVNSKTLNGSYTITGNTTVGGSVSATTLLTNGFNANSTGISATTISATTFIGDGSQITNVTPSVPYGIITAMATGNYLI